MANLTSSASWIAQRLDVKHRIGVAVHARPGAWAIAAINAETGEVLAWDGWYFDPLTEAETRPLADLPWDEHEGSPGALLQQGNATWLAGALGRWLAPTYSVARCAADLIGTHVNTHDYPETPQRFHESPVVAYLPVVDEDVLLARVEVESRAHPSLTAGALPLLRSILGR